MRAITDAAEKYGNGTILFTTRLTGGGTGELPYEKIDEFKAAIEAAGMSCGGTGSKVRPVVSVREPPASTD